MISYILQFFFLQEREIVERKSFRKKFKIN